MPFSLRSPHAPHDALPTLQPFGGPSQVTRFTVVEGPSFKSWCSSCGCAASWSAVAGRLHPRQISNMAVEVVGLQTLEGGPEHRAALPITFNARLKCASPAGCRFFLQPSPASFGCVDRLVFVYWSVRVEWVSGGAKGPGRHPQ